MSEAEQPNVYKKYQENHQKLLNEQKTLFNSYNDYFSSYLKQMENSFSTNDDVEEPVETKPEEATDLYSELAKMNASLTTALQSYEREISKLLKQFK